MKTDKQIFSNQHFVPQFYLRLFSDDKHTIAKYSKHYRRKTEKSSIARTASRNGLYDYEYEEHKLTSEIEEGLGLIEQKASKLIKRYDHNPADFANMDASEKATLARYFGLQYARTLKFRKFQESAFDYYIKRGVAEAEAIKNHTSIEGEMTKWLERPIYFINRTGPLVHEMLELARLTELTIYAYTWTLIKTRHDAFITSDSPMARITGDDGQDEFMIALGSRLVLLMTPSNSSDMHYLYEGDHPFAIMEIFQKAYNYNRLVCEQSYLEIYGQSKLIDEAVARYSPKFSMSEVHFTDTADENARLHERAFPIDVISTSDIDYYRILYRRKSRK